MATATTSRLMLGSLVVLTLLTGCASWQEDDAGGVALVFEDPAADPAQRCDLLAPATLEKLETDASAPCAEVVADLPLQGGAVRAVQVWGGEAQVRLSGDTVFLTATDTGWRVVAAGCQSRGDAPYDCEVEGP